MIKNLVKLANRLDYLGFTKEADLLDCILKKIAVPIEGIVELHKNEPLGYEFSEEDEEGNIISRPPDRIKRKNRVLRDERDREWKKHQMERSRLPIEEEEEAELGEWYGSLKELGDSIILIPFDKSEIDKNYEVLFGLAAIFGISQPKNYKELYNKVNFLSGMPYNREGNLEILKQVFPSLWLEISGILSAKKLNESDAIYMFYNQETSPDRSGFTKNPFYLAHDLGHSAFDSIDSDDWEFKGILKQFLFAVLNLYLSEIGDSLLEAIGEESLDQDDSITGINLGEFFGVTSNTDDIYGDIFADATSGRLTFNEKDIPNSIYFDSEIFKLPADQRSKAANLLQECINKIKTYINPNVNYGTFAPGPFGHLAGSVILQDV